MRKTLRGGNIGVLCNEKERKKIKAKGLRHIELSVLPSLLTI